MAGKKKKCTTSFQRSGTFPFMQLPPEIRNMIYRHLSIRTQNIGSEPTNIVDWAKQYRAYRQLDFGRTCRQIYEEHKSLFFSENGFEFYYNSAFVRFLEGIGISGRQLLTELKWNQGDVSAFTALRYLRTCQNMKRLDIVVDRNHHKFCHVRNALDCFVLKTTETFQKVLFTTPVTLSDRHMRRIVTAYNKIRREQKGGPMSANAIQLPSVWSNIDTFSTPKTGKSGAQR